MSLEAISAAGWVRPNPWQPPILAERGATGWVAANAVSTVAYFVLGMIVSRFFAAYGVFPAPIWLPASVAVLASMAGGLRMAPGIFLGSFLVNSVLFDAPLYAITIISVTNALGPMSGALLLRRLRPGKGLFGSFVGVVAFLICTTFLAPAISATGGAVAMTLSQPDLTQFYSIWVNWWVTDSGGTLYLAPTLVLWLKLEIEPEHAPKSRFDKRDLMVWAWIAAVSLVLFLTPPLRGTYIRSAFPFLLVVPLSWIALRMSLKSAYTLVTLVSIAATAGTVAGYGPFQTPFQAHSMTNPLQLVGVLVVLLAMNVLTIVSLVTERQAAQTANKVKSMFLANTSHELRTPLNAIIGFSSLIDGQTAGPLGNEQYAEYARLIRSSGEHLLALINDLLEMSKIEAGRHDLAEERVLLRTAIDEALSLVVSQARAKSIALRSELAPSDITLSADPRALLQILLNLLSNAIKFSREGGHVTVSASLAQDGSVAIRVADTGIGIPPDAIERVFDPFERARRTEMEHVSGTGLGLAITRGLVLLHEGTIRLESEVGHGTVAIVTLPAHRVVQHAPPALTAPTRAA